MRNVFDLVLLAGKRIHKVFGMNFITEKIIHNLSGLVLLLATQKICDCFFLSFSFYIVLDIRWGFT